MALFFKLRGNSPHGNTATPEALKSRLLKYQQLMDRAYEKPSSHRARTKVEEQYAHLAPCLPTEDQLLLKHPTTLKDLVDRFVAAEPENPKLLQALESYQQEFMRWQKNIYDLKAVNRLSKIKNTIYRDLAPHEHAMLNDKEGIATLIDAHRHNTRDRLIPKPPEVDVARASKTDIAADFPTQLRDYKKEMLAFESGMQSAEHSLADLPKALRKELNIAALQIPHDAETLKTLIGTLQKHPEHDAALKPVINKLRGLLESHKRISSLFQALSPQLEVKGIRLEALASHDALDVLIRQNSPKMPAALPETTQAITALVEEIPAAEIRPAAQPASPALLTYTYDPPQAKPPLEAPKIPEAVPVMAAKKAEVPLLGYTQETTAKALKVRGNRPLVETPPIIELPFKAEALAKKSGSKAKWVLGGIGVAAVAIGAFMTMGKGESKDNGQSAGR